MSRMQKWSGTILLLTVTAATAIVSAQVTRIPVNANEDETKRPAQTRLNMESKLVQTNRVMEGLVRRDFVSIEKAAGVLSEISLSPPPRLSLAGDDSEEAVYEHFRMEFARLSGKLERLARRQETEGVAWVHQNLMATCIACHDYIRDYP